MQWWEVVVAAGAVVTAVVVIARAFIAAAKTAAKVFGPHVADAIETALAPKFDAIDAELQANGGGSIKDAVNRTATTVDDLAGTVNDFVSYQHVRNHDLLNRTAATTGFVQLLHAYQIAEMDPELRAKLSELAIAKTDLHIDPPPGARP